MTDSSNATIFCFLLLEKVTPTTDAAISLGAGTARENDLAAQFSTLLKHFYFGLKTRLEVIGRLKDGALSAGTDQSFLDCSCFSQVCPGTWCAAAIRYGMGKEA